MKPVWISQYDAAVQPTLTYPALTLSDILTRATELYPEQPALRFYGRSISYWELDQFANQFAQGLIALNVRKGGVVGLMLPNLPQSVIGCFGSLRAGVIVTPINPLYVESEIERQVVDSGCEVLLALDQFFPRIHPLLGRTCLKHVVLTGMSEYLPFLKRFFYRLPLPSKSAARWQRETEKMGPRVHRLSQFLHGRQEHPRVPIFQDDLAVLQYTGGTAGVPKGVELTHRNLICNAWQCRQWMSSLREGAETFLAVLPLFHAYGLSACQNLAVSVAGTLVLLPRFQVSEVLSTIAQERVTVFPGIPAMYSAINNYQDRKRHDLRSLRVCISGAGPLHPSIQEQFEALTGARLVEGYGLTEAGPVTHINPVGGGSGARRRRSIGVPLADTEAKIVDMEAGERELPAGEVGELVVRGPQVMRRYWKREEESRTVLRDGWLFTGDLAYMDPTGFFYITGRKKEMIKSGGETIYPGEVEEIIMRHPKVKETVVVGLPQDLRGELVKAYVVLKEDEQATAGEILEHCRKDLAKFKVPKRIEFRRELPKTSIGKVLRRVLVEEELKKGQTKPAQGDEEEGEIP